MKVLSRLLAALCVFALATTPSDAQILQRLGLGRPEAPDKSVLKRVQEGEYAERCSAPVDASATGGEQAEAFDLLDTLVGAPPAAALGASTVPASQFDSRLMTIFNRLRAVQQPSNNVDARVDVDTSRSIDARQIGAGQILLTSGLVDAINGDTAASDEQVSDYYAFVLAHEYAHVLLCHYNRTTQVERNRKLLRTISMVGALFVVMQNSDAVRTANGVQITTNGEGAARDYIPVMAGLTLLRTINSSIVNPAWSRQQERDADWLAVELMKQAGYQPDNIGPVLSMLSTKDEEFNEQFRALAGAVPQQALSAAVLSFTSGNGQSDFRSMLTGIGINFAVQTFQRWRNAQLRHFHDDPERRTATLTNMIQATSTGTAATGFEAYASQTFSVDPTRAQQGAGLRTAANAELGGASTAIDAVRLLASGDTAGGCTAAENSVRSSPNLPGAREALGQCELTRGNNAQAATHLTAAIRSPAATVDDFLLVSTLWSEAGDRQKSEQALGLGKNRFGPNRFYIPRMQVASKFGDLMQINAISQECASNMSAPQELRTQCTTTAQTLLAPPGQAAQQQQQSQTNSVTNGLGSMMRGVTNAVRGQGNQQQQPPAQTPTP